MGQVLYYVSTSAYIIQEKKIGTLEKSQYTVQHEAFDWP